MEVSLGKEMYVDVYYSQSANKGKQRQRAGKIAHRQLSTQLTVVDCLITARRETTRQNDSDFHDQRQRMSYEAFFRFPFIALKA